MARRGSARGVAAAAAAVATAVPQILQEGKLVRSGLSWSRVQSQKAARRGRRGAARRGAAGWNTPRLGGRERLGPLLPGNGIESVRISPGLARPRQLGHLIARRGIRDSAFISRSALRLVRHGAAVRRVIHCAPRLFWSGSAFRPVDLRVESAALRPNGSADWPGGRGHGVGWLQDG